MRYYFCKTKSGLIQSGYVENPGLIPYPGFVEQPSDQNMQV